MRLVPIAWQGVAGHPIRTALTALGLMVGVVSLVSVVSAADTTVATVEQKAILTGGPEATFDISGVTGSGSLLRSQQLLAQLQNSVAPEIRGARFASTQDVSLGLDGEVFDSDVIFTDPDIRTLRPFPVVAGYWLDDADAGLSVVLNQTAYEASRATERGGLSLRVTGTTGDRAAPVKGVVNDGGARPKAYVHLRHLPDLLVNQEGQIKTTLEVSSPGLGINDLKSRLSELNALTATTTQWEVTRKDTVKQLAAEVSATRASFTTVGVLSLLVTAFAVANVGLSALRERSVELSLRRALGGRRWQIPSLMILESQIVALMAGAMAIPVSYFIYPFVAEQFGAPFGIEPPAYPWSSTFLGLAIGMLTALAGSVAPAIRALNTPISSMMRE